ncbi:hypothetical protein ACP70R_043899 [Stipagrostis hirtigluma subsp. patula]
MERLTTSPLLNLGPCPRRALGGCDKYYSWTPMPTAPSQSQEAYRRRQRHLHAS